MLEQKKNYRLRITTLRLTVNDNQHFLGIHIFYLFSTLVMLQKMIKCLSLVLIALASDFCLNRVVCQRTSGTILDVISWF